MDSQVRALSGTKGAFMEREEIKSLNIRRVWVIEHDKNGLAKRCRANYRVNGAPAQWAEVDVGDGGIFDFGAFQFEPHHTLYYRPETAWVANGAIRQQAPINLADADDVEDERRNGFSDVVADVRIDQLLDEKYQLAELVLLADKMLGDLSYSAEYAEKRASCTVELVEAE